MESSTESQVNIRKFDKNAVYTEYQDADVFTGIRLKTSDEALNSYMALAQKMGMEVLRGNLNLLSIIPPSKCLAEICLLQKLAIYNEILCKYVHEATKVPVSSPENSFQRVRLLCAGLIGACFQADKFTKSKQLVPNFKNEYLEGTMKDGTYFFAYTKSRAPNKNCIRIVGPNKSYILEEEEELTTKVANGADVSNILAYQGGKIKITFEDGSEYEIKRPSFELENCMSSDKNLKYSNLTDCYVLDKSSKVIAKLDFEAPAKKSVTNWFGKSESSMNVHNKSPIKISIYKAGPDFKPFQEPLEIGNANYCAYVKFKEKIYWKHDDKFEKWSYEGPCLNEKDSCCLKKPYQGLMKKKEFEKVDELLAKAEKDTPPEEFRREFAPEA